MILLNRLFVELNVLLIMDIYETSIKIFSVQNSCHLMETWPNKIPITDLIAKNFRETKIFGVMTMFLENRQFTMFLKIDCLLFNSRKAKAEASIGFLLFFLIALEEAIIVNVCIFYYSIEILQVFTTRRGVL